MIEIPYKLFTILIIGLACMAVMSGCVLATIPLPYAVLLFMGTWIGLITLFDQTQFLKPLNFEESARSR